MYIPSDKYGKPNLGKNVQIIGEANFGSEPYLIKIGDNTTISFDCAFVTHDAATRVIRNLEDGDKETVIYGPIVIGKNCFIGCRTVILPNVTIGDNVIIGAEALLITAYLQIQLLLALLAKRFAHWRHIEISIRMILCISFQSHLRKKRKYYWINLGIN